MLAGLSAAKRHNLPRALNESPTTKHQRRGPSSEAEYISGSALVPRR